MKALKYLLRCGTVLLTVASVGVFPARMGFAQTAGAPATNAAALKLIPQPREVGSDTPIALKSGVRIVANHSDAADQFTEHDLSEELTQRGIKVLETGPGHGAATIELLRVDTDHGRKLLTDAKVNFDEPMRAEGYVLLPAHDGIAAVAANATGLFYAAQTIKQLITGNAASAVLHTAQIRDWPAMRYRGMDDDLSRGPVPTLAYQKQQIRIFAAYKLNVYSPYFESTFRYDSNPLPAQPDGAMTSAEYAELAHYAEQYHVTVIPEQEAFGHLHNVLIYDKYADLAETPHGSVLAPGNPAALPLIKQWFTDLAAVTPGPFVHIGADETFDLGKGKTHDEVQQRGLGAVYIDFLNHIAATLKPLNKRILFWGDVAMNEPKLVPQLPKDMIAVPWTYDPDPKGFDRYILPFTQAGMETWVAPGVSNWSRVYPNNNAALGNIQGFVRDGQRLGSTGMLNTAWNDDGEGLFNQDWYGVLFGAAASWQPGESSIPAFEQSYAEVFHGDTTGNIDEAQREIMAAHTLLEPVGDGGVNDGLFWVDPWSVDGQAIAAKMRPVQHELRMHAERALELLAKAEQTQTLREADAIAALELGARRMDTIGLKFEFSDEIIDTYAHAQQAAANPKTPDDVDSALYQITDTNGRCQDLRNAYSLTRDLYEQAWLKENRPFWLHNVLVRYDVATQLWERRGNQFAEALSQWHRDHTLPSAASLGMPVRTAQP